MQEREPDYCAFQPVRVLLQSVAKELPHCRFL